MTQIKTRGETISAGGAAPGEGRRVHSAAGRSLGSGPGRQQSAPGHRGQGAASPAAAASVLGPARTIRRAEKPEALLNLQPWFRKAAARAWAHGRIESDIAQRRPGHAGRWALGQWWERAVARARGSD